MKKIMMLIGAAAVWLGLFPAAVSAVAPQQPTGSDKFHKPSELFSARADGRALFVEHFKAIHYVNFPVTGPTRIEAAFAGEVNDFRISPMILGIEWTQAGGTVSFTLPGPGWYVLEVNGREKLILLADPVETDVPRVGDAGVISVLDYVKSGSDDTLQTEALQRALDEASRTGKTLVFPRGVYRTGTLTVGSNSRIYLAEGALVKGSENREDYPSDGNRPEADHINNKANYSDNGEFMTFSRLLLVDNAENVRIWGRGIIDGSGTVIRAQGKPANLIRIRNSKDVLIEGVILRDPAAWNTHILHSERVTVRGVKVLNDFAVPNTDGFDPDASRDVLIENCFAYCNDDNIAIKTTNNMDLLQDLERVTVRGCVFITRKSSLKVGTETKAGRMSDILFEDNDVVECDRGMALYCYDGAAFENIRFVNNRVERNFPDNQRKAIHFQILSRSGKGHIRNVLFKDCAFDIMFPKGASMAGLDAEHCIDGVTFDGVTVAGKPVRSLSDLGMEEPRFVKNIRFK